MENAAAPATDNNPVAALCMGCMAPAAAGLFCPVCGWKRDTPAASVLHLPPGTRLQNYVVGRVLGQGGFGITYLGWDTQLQRKVAVKEYFPQNIASRVPDWSTVAPTSPGSRNNYAYGLDRLLAEGRTLARFADHPCIVSVMNLFEANNTGYLVMGYLEGMTLSQALEEAGGKLSYGAARDIMMRVMDGLREMHSQGMLHRDISPDNIYLTRQGPVKLLDFGAARMAVREASQDLSVMVKEGYAPPEQYLRSGNQGPWTDVYAAAATLYRIVTGVKPPTALERQAAESLVKPSVKCPDLPGQAEAAILKGMALKAAARYQTVEAFQKDLPAPPPPRGPEVPGEDDGAKKRQAGGNSGRNAAIAISIAAVCAVLVLGGWLGLRLLHSHYESEGEAAYRSGNFESARNNFEKASGNSRALYFLGRIFAKGEGVPQNLELGRTFFERAAKSGDAEAMDNLGFLYENGFGVLQDAGKAAEWYRQAAQAGSADAMGRLGVLYHDGRGVPKDLNQCRQWYEKGAKAGNLRAETNLGLLYARAEGVKYDANQAIGLMQKAADAGSAGAMAELGILYDNGKGVSKDPAQARQWYQKAADGGDPYAMVYLGDIYGNGRGVDRDLRRQRAYYDKAVAVAIPYAVDVNLNERRIISGRALAMLRIGDGYRYPVFGLADNSQAAHWYEKAAADGNAFAMFRMGQLYDGPGTYDTARTWYEKAAAAGDGAAMNNLGVLYYLGHGVSQSYENARGWYEKAAAAGNSTAMKNLGDMYNNGVLPRDLLKADEWWGKAADAGNTAAMAALAQDLYQSALNNIALRSQLGGWSLIDDKTILATLQRARDLAKRAADAGERGAAELIVKVDAAIQKVNPNPYLLPRFGGNR